jgi:type II secretory pathway pseudopilin PulG
MGLAGQPFGSAQGRGNRGYAMAALLVGMSVMAVLMSALLPVWTHMATREKEEELIFRGKQYARAIGLFQRKYANTPPPSIEVLVEQRFLRKKYKDPITKDDFQPVYANQQAMGQGGPGTSTVATRPGERATATISTPAQSNLQSGFGSTGIGPQGGIIGVTSKSKEKSIKVYNGRTAYNEWSFVYIQTTQRPGQSVPGAGIPGATGRPGQGGPGQKPQPFPGGPGMGIGPNGQPFPPGMGIPTRPPIQLQPGQAPGQFPGQFPGQLNPGTMPPGGIRPPGATRPPGQ